MLMHVWCLTVANVRVVFAHHADGSGALPFSM